MRYGHLALVGSICALGCAPSAVTRESASTHPSTPTTTGAVDAVELAACDWRIEGDVVVAPDGTRDEATRDEVDVDGRGPADVVAMLGGECGNWGDCIFVVLRACGPGGYEAIWGPDYATEVTVGASSEDGRPALVLGGRTGEGGCDLPLETTLRWSGESWEPTGTCAGEGVWDEDCGEPPFPACP